MSLQLAPESQQEQGQAHVPITTGMKPAFNSKMSNDKEMRRTYAQAEEQQCRAAQELKLVEEQGLLSTNGISAPVDVSTKTNNIDRSQDVGRSQFDGC